MADRCSCSAGTSIRKRKKSKNHVTNIFVRDNISHICDMQLVGSLGYAARLVNSSAKECFGDSVKLKHQAWRSWKSLSSYLSVETRELSKLLSFMKILAFALMYECCGITGTFKHTLIYYLSGVAKTAPTTICISCICHVDFCFFFSYVGMCRLNGEIRMPCYDLSMATIWVWLLSPLQVFLESPSHI